DCPSMNSSPVKNGIKIKSLGYILADEIHVLPDAHKRERDDTAIELGTHSSCCSGPSQRQSPAFK
ncbi:MAG: hypothetical protein ACK5II_11850, partial [Paracoccus sp. (in: a-proteobacteria)]